MSFFGRFLFFFDFLGGAMLVEVFEVSNQKLLAHEIATPPTATHPQKPKVHTFSKALRYQFWISMWNIMKYPVMKLDVFPSWVHWVKMTSCQNIFQAEDSSSLEALAFRLLRELWKDNDNQKGMVPWSTIHCCSWYLVYSDVLRRLIFLGGGFAK